MKAHTIQVGRMTIGDLRKIEGEIGIQPGSVPATVDEKPATEGSHLHTNLAAPPNTATDEPVVVPHMAELLPRELSVPTLPLQWQMSKASDEMAHPVAQAVAEADIFKMAPQTPSRPVEPINTVHSSPEESTPFNGPIQRTSRDEVCNSSKASLSFSLGGSIGYQLLLSWSHFQGICMLLWLASLADTYACVCWTML